MYFVCCWFFVLNLHKKLNLTGKFEPLVYTMGKKLLKEMAYTQWSSLCILFVCCFLFLVLNLPKKKLIIKLKLHVKTTCKNGKEITEGNGVHTNITHRPISVHLNVADIFIWTEYTYTWFVAIKTRYLFKLVTHMK